MQWIHPSHSAGSEVGDGRGFPILPFKIPIIVVFYFNTLFLNFQQYWKVETLSRNVYCVFGNQGTYQTTIINFR
jgi:hypothetical protein